MLNRNLEETFEIVVWFRYPSAREVKEDSETHEITASSIQEAVNKSESLYRNKVAIPFKYYFNDTEYRPTGLTQADLFHLTASHYEYP